jgi:hypothetical protein
MPRLPAATSRPGSRRHATNGWLAATSTWSARRSRSSIGSFVSAGGLRRRPGDFYDFIPDLEYFGRKVRSADASGRATRRFDDAGSLTLWSSADHNPIRFLKASHSLFRIPSCVETGSATVPLQPPLFSATIGQPPCAIGRNASSPGTVLSSL